MIFNSVSFLVFFIVVFLLYYFPFKEHTKAQNWLLLLSSYFFYGFADWKMVPVLLIATTSIFFLGRALAKTVDSKKSTLLSILGVLIGVGLLFYFKYFNFFINSFSSLLTTIGLKSNIGTFTILMPLGISYFTFKLISYIVEIKRGKIDSCNDFVSFSTYIAFFPTILAGPIDKPNSLIPQLQKKRSFNYAMVVEGCRQILWGAFQKIVIADNLAMAIDLVWGDISNQPGSTLFITAILYSIQVYNDFSGYSHMAIGVGKILGFRITKNFNYPYFSRNVAEFWRRWHISLTSWLTDYVFMPLNIKFRHLGNLGILLAIQINMVVVGIWHGANWTFALFGIYNGLLFVPLILSGSIFKREKLKVNSSDLPTCIDFLKIIGTFLILTMGFILFRAEDIGQAYIFVQGIFDASFFSIKPLYGLQIVPFILSMMVFIVEWDSREVEFPLCNLSAKFKRSYRYGIYYALIILIFWFSDKQQEFIYFQF